MMKYYETNGTITDLSPEHKYNTFFFIGGHIPINNFIFVPSFSAATATALVLVQCKKQNKKKHVLTHDTDIYS